MPVDWCLNEELKNGESRFHPLCLINGHPKIGQRVRLGVLSEVYDKGGIVEIGDDTDVGSFSAISCGDSHRRVVIDPQLAVDCRPIRIEQNVFIGSHCFVGGGTTIGHHSVVAAGTIIIGKKVPSYSLVWGAHPCRIRRGYYHGKT